MGARRRPVLLLDAPRGRWQGASLTWGLLAIDTIRWSGLQVGRRPDPIAYGRDQVVFKDYTAWRSADLTTCRVLGLMTMPTPKEAMEVAEAGESYAEYGIDKPRISRVDLTRDLLVPGMTVDRLAEGLRGRSDRFCVYSPPKGRGLTVHDPNWCQQIKIYDKGFEATKGELSSSVWRTEVQLTRSHLPDDKRTISRFRSGYSNRIEGMLNRFLANHGLWELIPHSPIGLN